MFSVEKKKMIAITLAVANFFTMSGFNYLSSAVAAMVYNARVNKEDTTNYYKEMVEYMYSVEYESTKVSYVQADTGFSINNEEDLANYNAAKNGNKENDEGSDHTNSLESKKDDNALEEENVSKDENIEETEGETSEDIEVEETDEKTEPTKEEDEIEDEIESEEELEEEPEEEIEEETEKKIEETEDVEETTIGNETSEEDEIEGTTSKEEEEETIESEEETVEESKEEESTIESEVETETEIETTIEEEKEETKTSQEIIPEETSIEETTLEKIVETTTKPMVDLETAEEETATESEIVEDEIVEATESEMVEETEINEDEVIEATESEIVEDEVNEATESEVVEEEVNEATESEIDEVKDATDSEVIKDGVSAVEENIIVAPLTKSRWNIEKILLDDTKIPMIKDEEDIEDIKENRLPKEVQVVLKNSDGKEKTISVKTSWIVEEMSEEEVEEWIKVNNIVKISDDDEIVSSSNEAKLVDKYQNLIKDKLGEEKEVVVVEKTDKENEKDTTTTKEENVVEEVEEEAEEDEDIIVGMLGDSSSNEKEELEDETTIEETTTEEETTVEETTTKQEQTKEIVDLEIEEITTKEETTVEETIKEDETFVEEETIKEEVVEIEETTTVVSLDVEETTNEEVETNETTVEEITTEKETKEVINLEVEEKTTTEEKEETNETTVEETTTIVELGMEETTKETETQTTEATSIEEETTEEIKEGEVLEPKAIEEDKEEIEDLDGDGIERIVADNYINKTQMDKVDKVYTIYLDEEFLFDEITRILLEEEKKEKAKIAQNSNAKKIAEEEKKEEVNEVVEETKEEEVSLFSNIVNLFKTPKILKASNDANVNEVNKATESEVNKSTESEALDTEDEEVIIEEPSVNDKAKELIDESEDSIIEITYNPNLGKRYMFSGGVLKAIKIHKNDHPLCGETCPHTPIHSLGSYTWQSINPTGDTQVNLGGNQNDKFYYIESGAGSVFTLYGDATVDAGHKIAICLNGGILSLDNFSITGGGEVYFCNCNPDSTSQLTIGDESGNPGFVQKRTFKVGKLYIRKMNLAFVYSNNKTLPLYEPNGTSEVTIEEVEVSNLKSNVAVFNFSGNESFTFNIKGSKVLGCQNMAGNGTILSVTGGNPSTTRNINIDSTKFETCLAKNGGVMYVDVAIGTTNIDFKGSGVNDFVGCQAQTGKGGVIYIKDTSVTSGIQKFNTLDFMNCNANEGGAIYYERGLSGASGGTGVVFDGVKVEYSKRYNTDATYNGGAVFLKGSIYEFNGCDISHCQNGALYLDAATVKFNDSTIHDNTTEHTNIGQVIDYNRAAVSSITLTNTKIYANRHFKTSHTTGTAKTQININNKTLIYDNKDYNTNSPINLIYDEDFCVLTLANDYEVPEKAIGVTILKDTEQKFLDLWQNTQTYNQLRKFGPNDVFYIENASAINVIYVRQETTIKQNLYIGSAYKEVHYLSQYEGQASKVLGVNIEHIVQYYAAVNPAGNDKVVLSKPFNMASAENRKPYEKEGTTLIGFVNGSGYLDFDKETTETITRTINIDIDEERKVTGIYASETLKYKACGCLESQECDHPGFEGLNHIARGGIVAVDADTYDHAKKENWVLVTTLSQLRYQYQNKYTQYILQNDLIYEHLSGTTDLIKPGVVILNGYKVIERVAGNENYWLGGTGGSYVSDMEPFPKNTCVGTLQYDTVGYTLDFADLTNYQPIDANEQGDRFIRNVDITNSAAFSINRLFSSINADYVLENVKITNINKDSTMAGVSSVMFGVSSLKTNNVIMKDIKITDNTGTGISGRNFISLKNNNSTISVIKNTTFDGIEALKIIDYSRDSSAPVLTNLDVLKFEDFEMKNCKAFSGGGGIEVHDTTTNAKMYMDKEIKITNNEYGDKAQILSIDNVKNIISTGSTLDIENNTMNVTTYASNEIREMVNVKGGTLNNFEHNLYGKVLLTQNKFKFGGTVDTSIAANMVFTALYPMNYTNIKIGNEKIFIKDNTMENMTDVNVLNKNCSIYIDGANYVAQPLFSQLEGTKMNTESFFNITTSDTLQYGGVREALVYENWDNAHVNEFDGFYTFISQRWGKDNEVAPDVKYYLSGSKLYLGENYIDVLYQFRFSGETSKKGNTIEDISTLIRRGDASANVVDLSDPNNRNRYEVPGYALVGFVGHSTTYSDDYYKTWDFVNDVLDASSYWPFDRILQAVYAYEDYKIKACGCAEGVECDHAGYEGFNHVVRGEKAGDNYDINKKQYMNYIAVSTATQLFYTYDMVEGSVATRYNTQYVLENDINFDDVFDTPTGFVDNRLKGERVLNFNNHRINCAIGLAGIFNLSYDRKTYIREPGDMPNTIVLGNTDAERAAGTEYTYDYAGVTLSGVNNFIGYILNEEKVMMRNMTIKNYDATSGYGTSLFNGSNSSSNDTMYSLENILVKDCVLEDDAIRANEVKLTNVTFDNVKFVTNENASIVNIARCNKATTSLCAFKNVKVTGNSEFYYFVKQDETYHPGGSFEDNFILENVEVSQSSLNKNVMFDFGIGLASGKKSKVIFKDTNKVYNNFVNEPSGATSTPLLFRFNNDKLVIATSATLDVCYNVYNLDPSFAGSAANREINMVYFNSATAQNNKEEIYGSFGFHDNIFNIDDTAGFANLVYKVFNINNYTNFLLGQDKVYICDNKIQDMDATPVKNYDYDLFNVYVKNNEYKTQPIFTQVEGTKLNATDSMIAVSFDPSLIVGVKEEILAYSNWDEDHVGGFQAQYEYVSTCWRVDNAEKIAYSERNYYISGSKLYLGRNYTQVIYQFMFAGQRSKAGTEIKDIVTFIRADDKIANVVNINSDESRAKFEIEDYTMIGFVGHSKFTPVGEDYYKTWDFENDVVDCDLTLQDRILQAVYVADELKVRICGLPESIECKHLGYESAIDGHIIRGHISRDYVPIESKMRESYVVVSTITQLYYTYKHRNAMGALLGEYNTQYVLYNDIIVRDNNIKLRGERAILYNNHSFINDSGVEIFDFTYPRKSYLREVNLPQNTFTGSLDEDYESGIQSVMDFKNCHFTNDYLTIKGTESIMIRNMKFANFATTSNNKSIFNVNSPITTEIALENVTFDNVKTSANVIHAQNANMTKVAFNKIEGTNPTININNKIRAKDLSLKNSNLTNDFLVVTKELINVGLDVQSNIIAGNLIKSIDVASINSIKIEKTTFTNNDAIYLAKASVSEVIVNLSTFSAANSAVIRVQKAAEPENGRINKFKNITIINSTIHNGISVICNVPNTTNKSIPTTIDTFEAFGNNIYEKLINISPYTSSFNPKLTKVELLNSISIHNNTFYNKANAIYIKGERLVIATNSSLVVKDNNNKITEFAVNQEYAYMYLDSGAINEHYTDFYGSVNFNNNNYTVNNYHINNRTNEYTAIQLVTIQAAKITIGNKKVEILGTKILGSTDSELTNYHNHNLYQKNTIQNQPMFVQAPGTMLNSSENKIFVSLMPLEGNNKLIYKNFDTAHVKNYSENYSFIYQMFDHDECMNTNGQRNRYYKSDTLDPVTNLRQKDLYFGSNCALVEYKVLEDEYGYVTRDVAHEEWDITGTIVTIVTESVTSWEQIRATYTTVESQYYIKDVEIKLEYIQPSFSTNLFDWKATKSMPDGNIYFVTFNRDMSDAYYTLVSDMVVIGREVTPHSHEVYGYKNSTTSDIMDFYISGYDEDSFANSCGQIALQRDIHITHKLPVNPDKDYTICLNGHSIYIENIPNNQWMSTLNSNSNFYICDCKPKEQRGGIYSRKVNSTVISGINARINMNNDLYIDNVDFKDNTVENGRDLSMLIYALYSKNIHIRNIDYKNNDVSAPFLTAYNQNYGSVELTNVTVENNRFHNSNFLNIGRLYATYSNLKINNNVQEFNTMKDDGMMLLEQSVNSYFDNLEVKNNKVNNSLINHKRNSSFVYFSGGLTFENNEIATFGDAYPLWQVLNNSISMKFDYKNDGKDYIIRNNRNLDADADSAFAFYGDVDFKNIIVDNNYNKHNSILTFGKNTTLKNVKLRGNIASNSYIIVFSGKEKDVTMENVDILNNGIHATISDINGGLIYATQSHMLFKNVNINGNYGEGEGVFLEGHYAKSTTEMFMDTVNINDNHGFKSLLKLKESHANPVQNVNLKNVTVTQNDTKGDVIVFDNIRDQVDFQYLKVENNKAYKSVFAMKDLAKEVDFWKDAKHNSITNNHLYSGKNSTVSDVITGAIRFDGNTVFTIGGHVNISGNYDCNGEEANLELNDNSYLKILSTNKITADSRIHIRKTNMDKRIVNSGAWNESFIEGFSTFAGDKIFNDIDKIFVTDGNDTEKIWATVSDVWQEVDTKPKHVYKKGERSGTSPNFTGPEIWFGLDYQYLLYQDQDVEPPRILATQCIANGVLTTVDPLKDPSGRTTWYGPKPTDENNTQTWSCMTNGSYSSNTNVTITRDAYTRVGTHKHGTDEFMLVGSETDLKDAINAALSSGGTKKIALMSGVTLTDATFYESKNLNGFIICLNSFAMKVNTGVTFVKLTSGEVTIMDCLKSSMKGSISSDGGVGDINKHAFELTGASSKLNLLNIDIRNFNGGSPIYASNSATIDISGLDIKFNNVDKGAIHLDNAEAVAHTEFLAQGNVSEYGGAFYAANGSTVIFEDDATFRENRAYIYGGGMYFTGHSTLKFMKNATFERNMNEGRREAFGKVIGGDGGGLYMNDSCEIQQNIGSSRILFKNNYAMNDGGGLYLAKCDNDTIVFSHIEFEENEAYNGGAMVIASSSAVTIASMSFRKNKANMTGGAMYLLSNTGLTVTDCQFEENTTGFDVHTYNVYDYKVDNTVIDAQSIDITNFRDYVFVEASRSYSAEVMRRAFDDRDVIGVVYDVRASDSTGTLDTETVKIYTRLDELFGDGGAMCIKSNGFDRNLHIENSRFINNFSGNGGAMKVDDTHGGTFISGCYFNNNRANTGSGGAMLISNIFREDLSIKNTNFIANIASKSGGAISFTGVEDDQETYSRVPGKEDYPCGLDIYECAFYDNEAQNSTAVGGAISAVNAERIKIQGLAYHTIIPGATDSETGVWIATREETTPREVTFRGNKAGFAGGAIYYNELMYSNGANSDLFDSHPGDVGLILTDVSIQGNECGYYGGGIFMRASYSSVVLPVTQNKGNIEDNVCTGQLGTGGAMYLFGKVQYIVDDITLKNNYAVIGGNVYVNAVKTHMKPVYKVFIDGERQEHEVKFKNVRLSGGDAPRPEYRNIQNGGAFAVYYGKIELDACDISSCNNAIYTVGGDILTKNNTRIHNNRGQYSVGFSSFMKSTVSLVDTFVINNEITEEPILTLFNKVNPNTPSQVTKTQYWEKKEDPNFYNTYTFDGELKNKVLFGGKVIFKNNYYITSSGERLDNNLCIHDDQRMMLAGSTEYPLQEGSELWINAKEGMRVFSEWGPTRIDRHNDGNMYSRIFRIDNEDKFNTDPSLKPIKIYKQGLAAKVVYDTPTEKHIEGPENCHLYLGRDYQTLEYIEDFEPYVRLATEYIATGTPTTADSCFVEGFGSQRYVQIWKGPRYYPETGEIFPDTKWNIKQQNNNEVFLTSDAIVGYQLRHVHRLCGLPLEGTCSEASHSREHEYLDYMYVTGDTNLQRLNKITLANYQEDFSDNPRTLLAVLLYQTTLTVSHSFNVNLADVDTFGICLNGGSLEFNENVKPFWYQDATGYHEGVPENCTVMICDCEGPTEYPEGHFGSLKRIDDTSIVLPEGIPMLGEFKGGLGLYRLSIQDLTPRADGIDSLARIKGGSLEIGNTIFKNNKTVRNKPFIEMDESSTGYISIGDVKIEDNLGEATFIKLSAAEASISNVNVIDNNMTNNPVISIYGANNMKLTLGDGRYVNNTKKFIGSMRPLEGVVYRIDRVKSVINKGISYFAGNKSQSGKFNGDDGGVVYFSDIGPMTEPKVHGVMVFENNEVDLGTVVIGSVSVSGDLYSMYLTKNKTRLGAPGIYVKGPTVGNNTLTLASLSIINNTLVSGATNKDGQAIYIEKGSVTLGGRTFIENTQNPIYNNGGTFGMEYRNQVHNDTYIEQARKFYPFITTSTDSVLIAKMNADIEKYWNYHENVLMREILIQKNTGDYVLSANYKNGAKFNLLGGMIRNNTVTKSAYVVTTPSYIGATSISKNIYVNFGGNINIANNKQGSTLKNIKILNNDLEKFDVYNEEDPLHPGDPFFNIFKKVNKNAKLYFTATVPDQVIMQHCNSSSMENYLVDGFKLASVAFIDNPNYGIPEYGRYFEIYTFHNTGYLGFNQFTFSFMGNGGYYYETGAELDFATKSVALEREFGYIPVPKRTGYSYVGLNLQPDGLGMWITEDFFYEDSSIDTAYAQWVPNHYTLRYDKNAPLAMNTMADVPMIYDQGYNLDNNQFIYKRHEFAYWEATLSNGTVATYSEGDYVINLRTATGAIAHVRAVWNTLPSTDSYIVKFVPGDMTPWTNSTMSDIKVLIEATFSMPTNGFVLFGDGERDMVFDYWALTNIPYDDYGNPVPPKSTFSEGETAVLLATDNECVAIVEARWKPRSYFIRFNPNPPASPLPGATNPATGEMELHKRKYGDIIPLPKSKFEVVGYTFAGWSTDSNATEPTYLDEEEGISKLTYEDNGIVDFYAVWKNKTYKVYYEEPLLSEVFMDPKYVIATYDMPFGNYVNPEASGSLIKNKWGWTWTKCESDMTSIAEAEAWALAQPTIYSVEHPEYQRDMSSGIGLVNNQEYYRIPYDTKVYMIYNKAGFEIHYKNDDGTDLDMSFNTHLPITHSNQLDIISEPVRPGYTFLYWTGPGIDESERKKTIRIEADDISLDDRTYVAHWNGAPITIYLDKNGRGELNYGMTDYVIANRGESVYIPEVFNHGKDINYTYSYYCENSDGSGTQYKANMFHLLDTEGDTIRLYAIWKKIDNSNSSSGTGGGGGGTISKGLVNPNLNGSAYTIAAGQIADVQWYKDVNNEWHAKAQYAGDLTGWQRICDNNSWNWYYFDEEGKMQTGWISQNNKVYYMEEYNSAGNMLTGRRFINGVWYDLNAKGELEGLAAGNANMNIQQVKGYDVDKSTLISGSFIYDNTDASFKYVRGYNTGKTDLLRDGIYKINYRNKESFYGFDEDGKMLVGFQVLGNSLYYFSEKQENLGEMAIGEVVIGESKYIFDEQGRFLRDQYLLMLTSGNGTTLGVPPINVDPNFKIVTNGSANRMLKANEALEEAKQLQEAAQKESTVYQKGDSTIPILDAERANEVHIVTNTRSYNPAAIANPAQGGGTQRVGTLKKVRKSKVIGNVARNGDTNSIQNANNQETNVVNNVTSQNQNAGTNVINNVTSQRGEELPKNNIINSIVNVINNIVPKINTEVPQTNQNAGTGIINNVVPKINTEIPQTNQNAGTGVINNVVPKINTNVPQINQNIGTGVINNITSKMGTEISQPVNQNNGTNVINNTKNQSNEANVPIVPYVSKDVKNENNVINNTILQRETKAPPVLNQNNGTNVINNVGQRVNPSSPYLSNDLTKEVPKSNTNQPTQQQDVASQALLNAALQAQQLTQQQAQQEAIVRAQQLAREQSQKAANASLQNKPKQEPKKTQPKKEIVDLDMLSNTDNKVSQPLLSAKTSHDYGVVLDMN